mmetsp:Transcript_13971/g.37584  ORF Transcript_13971/g.37584 Transcript_13971/m.37584 type:complete len:96 (+) Transcript_13971:1047-1334(+)
MPGQVAHKSARLHRRECRLRVRCTKPGDASLARSGSWTTPAEQRRPVAARMAVRASAAMRVSQEHITWAMTICPSRSISGDTGGGHGGSGPGIGP